MPSAVVLVPLDDRPCCLQFVLRLGELAGQKLLVPPAPLLGRFQQPGHCQSLIEWYQHNVVGARAAIVSLDMLAFGGLVASRRAQPTLEQARSLLEEWLEVAKIGPPVAACQSILRTAPTQTTAEEMAQARTIVELSTLRARQARGESGLEGAILRLEEALPEGALERYMRTRERNHQLNREALEWLRRGRLDSLLLGIDDSKTLGWNVLEVARLSGDLPPGAHIAPGTDESTQLLLSRLCHPGRAVQVVWSDPQLPSTVTKYEDRCLGEVVRAQMEAAQLVAVEDSFWQLFVYGRPGPQGEAEEQRPQPVPRSFLEALRGSLGQGRRVVVADVAHANGGDLDLGRSLAPHLERLLGYSAWNTAGNTLGTALAWLGCAQDDPDATQRAAEVRFLRERWLDDLVYQSLVRPHLRQELGSLGLTLTSSQQARCQEELAGLLRSRSLSLGLPLEGGLQATLPWGRLFEVAVEVEV